MKPPTIQTVLNQKNNTQCLRVPIKMPSTAGQEVVVPYGGTFYGVVSASGVVSGHIGEDTPGVLPIGILRIMPEGVIFGKDNRNLKISSSVAGDIVTLSMGYGAEIPLDVLASLITGPAGLPQVQNVSLAFQPNNTVRPFLPAGDFKYLVLTVNNYILGDNFQVIRYNQEGIPMFGPAPTLYPGAVNTWDGNIYTFKGDVIATRPVYVPNPAIIEVFTVLIPVMGAQQIQVIFQTTSAILQTSGQFSNNGFD